MLKVRNVVARGDKTKDTKLVFIKTITWSSRALALGKWPDMDWDGTPFPAGSSGDMKKGMWLADGTCG